MSLMKDIAPGRSGAIGVFDSGLGGLTVLKEILAELPSESTVYFGDSGRYPYGTKSRDTIIRFAEQDSAFLLSKGVKILVIACNTASSYAYEHLKDSAGVPVIEVITPGAAAAVRATRNGRVGIIGTSATISSLVYEKAVLDHASKARPDLKTEVFAAACPLFVGLAEEGWWDDEITVLTAARYLEPLVRERVDTLILGCTHYPLIKGAIAKVMGPDVELVDSAVETVKRINEVLDSNDLKDTSHSTVSRFHEYYTSDSEEKFRCLGSSFLQQEIGKAVKIDIELYAAKISSSGKV